MSTQQGDAASRQLAQNPSTWQLDHDEMITVELRQAAYDMVDRKFTGPKRAELRQWIYRRRTASGLRGLMKRLDGLPDVGSS